MSFALDHFRHAVAASAHGSFRRAAEALGVRQSTLSRSIRQLENLLGVTVFERFSGGVRPTFAGTEFLQRARAILEQIDALTTLAWAIGVGEAGRLSIGFHTSLAGGNLRATLVEISKRYPQLDLNMHEIPRLRLTDALRARTVDIAIIPGPLAFPDCESMALWSERVIVATPESHVLAGQDAISWADLRGERMLLTQLDPGPLFEDLIIANIASPGERPQILRHDVSRASVMCLVGAGFGITLLTEASAGASVVGLAYRELRKDAEPERIGYSAHWRADNANPALGNLLSLLRERHPVLVPR